MRPDTAKWMLVKTRVLVCVVCVWGGRNDIGLQGEVNVGGWVGGGVATEVAWVVCTVSDRSSNLLVGFFLQRGSILLAANEPSKYVVFTFKVAVARPSSASG